MSRGFPETLRRLSTDFGTFQFAWTYFELYVEIIGHKVLKTSTLHSSIVFGTLGFGVKQKIVIALLKEEGSEQADEIARSIRYIVSEAARNHLVHSSVHFGTENLYFSFVKRSIDNGLEAKDKIFSPGEFERHVGALSDKIEELRELAGIEDEHIADYIKEAYKYSSGVGPD